MSDLTNILLDSDPDEPVEFGSRLERVARLAAPVTGRCLHGFAIGSGLCAVRGCNAFGDPREVRTCCACRKPYTSSRGGKGRCDCCAKLRRRHRGSL